MFYTIYKTTNLVNGKFYIGKHQTSNLDDGYLGSGRILKKAIEKYGVDNFHKEILYICETEKQMNTLEKILVVPDIETNYNLTKGGKGSFFYANKVCTPEDKKIHQNRQIFLDKIKNDKEFKQIWIDNLKKAAIKSAPKNSATNKKRFAEGAVNPFKDKSHTQEYKDKMSSIMKEKSKGQGNSQYGTCWITNGVENKKIKKEELDSWIELGYNKGRFIVPLV